MGEASPPTAVKRWQKPRIYLTIVALYFIGSGIGFYSFGYISYQESYAQYREDPDHALGIAMFGTLLYIEFFYLILAGWAAFSLLRKKPRFIVASVIVLASVAFFSFFIFLTTDTLLSVCIFNPNEYNSCVLSTNAYWFWAAMFALNCLMLTLLYKGRQGYKKAIKQVH